METDPRGVWRGDPLSCPIFPSSLKLECEKLASEKTEMQRHYVMVGVPALAAPPPALPKEGSLGYQALGTACLSVSLSPTLAHLLGSPSGSPWDSGLSCPALMLPPLARLGQRSVSPGWGWLSTLANAVSFAVLRDVLRPQH